MNDAQKLQTMLEKNAQFSSWFEEYLKSTVFKKTYPQDIKDLFGKSYLTAFCSFDKIYSKFEDEMAKATNAVDLHTVWINFRLRNQQAGDVEKTELSKNQELIQDFNKIFS
jgi:hypothetical protein